MKCFEYFKTFLSLKKIKDIKLLLDKLILFLEAVFILLLCFYTLNILIITSKVYSFGFNGSWLSF